MILVAKESSWSHMVVQSFTENKDRNLSIAVGMLLGLLWWIVARHRLADRNILRFWMAARKTLGAASFDPAIIEERLK